MNKRREYLSYINGFEINIKFKNIQKTLLMSLLLESLDMNCEFNNQPIFQSNSEDLFEMMLHEQQILPVFESS